jgi:predicted  nucleic acid-binding Zn-ribbon protein
MPEGAALLEDWLTNQDELEKQIFAQLDADGIDGEQQLYYAAFARRLFATCLRFYDATYAKEKTSLKNEFLLRGLDDAELETIIGICDSKCRLVRGIVVSLQDIEDKLDNATWGLAAIKALVDALEGKLDDPTTGLAAIKTLIDMIEAKLDDASHGLSALKTLIDAIEAKLDNATYGLAALKALIDDLEAKLDDGTNGLVAIKTAINAIEAKLDNGTYGLAALNTDLDAIIVYVDEVESLLKNATYGLSALDTQIDALKTELDRNKPNMIFPSVTSAVINLPAAPLDTNLPDVVISKIPVGATVDYALVVLEIRAIENTNGGGTNAIEGTQYVRIKKSTGAWGVNDIEAIQLIDNMWTLAALAREFGHVPIGDATRDVSSVVDGNATYNLRFEDANVDLDFLRLNDVQVMIKVWYH